MCRGFHISRRRRVLWTGITLFCLLFQQLAMAAYICTLPAVSTNVAMTRHCAGMGMSSASETSTTTHQYSVDPRCAEHCAGTLAPTHDASPPTVPPLLLASTSPVMPGAIVHADRVILPNVALHRSDPPPMLRFCSLLI